METGFDKVFFSCKILSQTLNLYSVTAWLRALICRTHFRISINCVPTLDSAKPYRTRPAMLVAKYRRPNGSE